MGITGEVLVVPLHLTSRRVKCQRRITVESVAVGSTRITCPWFGLRCAVIHKTTHWIVTTGNPCIATSPKQDGQIPPCVSAPLARTCNRRRLPRNLTGARIQADDVTGLFAVTLATAQSCYDDPIGNNRPARKSIAVKVRHHGRIPTHLTSSCIKTDNVRIDRI